MDISPDDYLYFTASQIHRMTRFNYGKDKQLLPYKFFKVWLAPEPVNLKSRVLWMLVKIQGGPLQNTGLIYDLYPEKVNIVGGPAALLQRINEEHREVGWLS